jgi:hypothetical protein
MCSEARTVASRRACTRERLPWSCCLAAADIAGTLTIELLLRAASTWRLKRFNYWPEKAVACREEESVLRSSSTIPSITVGRKHPLPTVEGAGNE